MKQVIYRHRGLEKLSNLLSSFPSKWQRQNGNVVVLKFTSLLFRGRQNEGKNKSEKSRIILFPP